MNLSEMSFETADAIFTEARAFLDAPDPPDADRWNQVLTFDFYGTELDEESGERQKYIDRVRPYIADKLDHSWPDHLRVLVSWDQPEDESYWALGRTLEINYDWSGMTKKGLKELAKQWAHPRFARYTGLELQGLAERNLPLLVEALTEENFKDLTFLEIMFDYEHFGDEGRFSSKYDDFIKPLFSKWSTSLQKLSIMCPAIGYQDLLADVLLERLSHDLPNMPRLTWFEMPSFQMVREKAISKLLQSTQHTTITQVSLPEANEDAIDDLIDLAERSPALFEHLDALLIDRLDDERYITLMKSEGLAHLSEKRFFKGWDNKTWEDTSYKLTADLATDLGEGGGLSRETLTARELELEFYETFGYPEFLALIGDPDAPNVFNHLEYLKLEEIDEESMFLLSRVAHVSFPNVREIELVTTHYAVFDQPAPCAWPSLRKLVIDCENFRFASITTSESFPTLDTLRVNYTSRADWSFILNSPDHFPSLKNLAISSGFEEGDNDWTALFQALRQSPLLDQLHSITMEYDSFDFDLDRITSYVELARDEHVPLAFRSYAFQHARYIHRTKALLLRLFRHLGVDADRSQSREELEALFLELFPEDARSGEDEDTIDVREIKRF